MYNCDVNLSLQAQLLQQWVQQANLTNAVINISDPSNPLQYMPPMMVRFPSAVPLNLLPLIMNSPAIAQEDVNFLRDAVFTADILSDPLVDSSSVIVTFRGRVNVSTRCACIIIINTVRFHTSVRVFDPVFVTS